MQTTPFQSNLKNIRFSLRPFLPCIAFILFATWGLSLQADDIPVAPIETTLFEGHDNFLLQNEKIAVAIDPIVGGLVSLTYRESDNLLSKENPGNQPGEGTVIETDAPNSNKAWKGRAWKSTDGSKHALLTRQLGPPLDLKCTRHYRLDAERAILSIADKIDRTGYSQSPVAIVSFLNIAKGFPAYHPQAGTNTLPCEGIALLSNNEDLKHENNKGWLAAQQDDILIVQDFHASASTATPTQTGHSRMTHSEGKLMHLHQQSPSASLQPGDRIAQTIVLHIVRSATNLPPCEVKEKIESLLSAEY